MAKEPLKESREPDPAGNDIGDYAQLFAAVLTVVLLVVSATSIPDLFRKVSVVLISIAVCNIVIYLYRHRGRLNDRRIWLRTATNIVVLIVSSLITFVVLPTPSSTTALSMSPSTSATPGQRPPIQQPPNAPTPILDKKGYALQRSSSVDTNDQDKIDLDTACPGWGGMSIRVGPRRCGELADIIVDEEGLHTPENKPQLATLPPNSSDYETCRDLFSQKPNGAVSIIQTSDLKPGGRLCVQTDKRNIAVVQVDHLTLDALGDLEKITVSFTVWTP